MIPTRLEELCSRQAGDGGRDDAACVAEELENLGIAADSEFAQVASAYNLAMLSKGGASLEQLIDPCWPIRDMASAAEFAHSQWQIPSNFVPFTTLEGEGAYLLDTATGKIWDFALQRRDEFCSGSQMPMFEGFFEFLMWYLED